MIEKSKEKSPLISVIVPIYNVERFLERCINSIVVQTYRNIEILLIDDGSTDNSGRIADEWIKKDTRIKVFHKKNGGLSDARNYGIEKAQGRYLSFIDSDDYIDYKMIETLHNNMYNYNADISIISFEMIQEDDVCYIDNHINSNIKLYDSKDGIKELFKEDSFGNFAWNKLYNAKLFSNIRYPIGKKMEDIGTTYKLFDLANNIVFSNNKMYYYVQREGSILHSQNDKLIFDKYDLMKERFIFLNNKYKNFLENDIYYFNNGIIIYPYLDNKRKNDFILTINSLSNQREILKNSSLKDCGRFILFKYFKKVYCIIKRRRNK